MVFSITPDGSLREDQLAPRPADIGRERTRAILEQWADHTGSLACAAASAACDSLQPIGMAPITLPDAAVTR